MIIGVIFFLLSNLLNSFYFFVEREQIVFYISKHVWLTPVMQIHTLRINVHSYFSESWASIPRVLKREEKQVGVHVIDMYRKDIKSIHYVIMLLRNLFKSTDTQIWRRKISKNGFFIIIIQLRINSINYADFFYPSIFIYISIKYFFLSLIEWFFFAIF
jgi:hypothetical protein